MDGKSIYRPLAAHTRAPDSSALPSHLGYSCVAAIHLANSSSPPQSSVAPTAIHHKLPRVSCYCCSPQLDSLAPPAALDSHAYRRTPKRFVMFLKPTTRTPTFSCSVSKGPFPQLTKTLFKGYFDGLITGGSACASQGLAEFAFGSPPYLPKT